MSTLEAREAALVAWAIALTGVPASAVGFKNSVGANVITRGSSIDLSWVSEVNVGRDEIRTEENDAVPAPGANLTPTQVGNRLLSLQVSIEVADQRPAANARSLANRFRGRVRLPSLLAALAAANIGLVSIGNTTNLDYNSENRMVSRAVFEVRLNATSFERAETAEQIGSIDRVDVTSHITDPSGAPLPADEQLINEVMP